MDNSILIYSIVAYIVVVTLVCVNLAYRLATAADLLGTPVDRWLTTVLSPRGGEAKWS